jgi:hypothetical protein
MPSGSAGTRSDIDAWDHVEAEGTHAGMVIASPEADVLQGAEEYLRYALGRPALEPELAERIRAALARWTSRAAAAGWRSSAQAWKCVFSALGPDVIRVRTLRAPPRDPRTAAGPGSGSLPGPCAGS